MPKYLVQASYSAEGTKGLLKDGGSKRKTVVQKMASSFGGNVEAFYFAFGESDVYIIMDAPDNVTAAAVSLAVNATGAVALKTTPLLSPEEIDQAARKSLAYQPPGS
ncbi:MAG TPA: GYD domain-containing protein [Vicinamibacterales bacterium]|nr:GYD domain-containing protein [Vicinamibacterales bacterium]